MALTFLQLSLIVLVIVVILNFIVERNVNKQIQLSEEKEPVDAIILHYQTWCPPCRAFKPIFQQFKDEMGSEQQPIELVDCGEQPLLCQDIAGYPTVRTLKGKIKYTGPRTLEGLKEFAEQVKNGTLSTN